MNFGDVIRQLHSKLVEESSPSDPTSRQSHPSDMEHFRYNTLWFSILCVIICYCDFFGFVLTKTAPEFTVTVSTKNFKEIRIPMALWKQIIKTNYDPSLKKIQGVNSKNSTNSKKKKVPAKQTLAQPADDTVYDIVEEASSLEDRPTNEVIIEVVVPETLESMQENLQSVPVKPEAVQGAVSDVQSEVADAVVSPMVQSSPLEAVATPLQEAVVAPVQDAVVAPVQDVVPTSPASVLVQSFRFPCMCANRTCDCCATMFSQKGCARVAFLPEEFAFDMRMTMNGDLVARRKLPISDPPPLCINPRRAPFLEVCAQINNIHVRKENVHLCVDLNAGVGGFDLFSWNYNCIKFGNKGLFTGLNPETATAAGRPQEDDGLLSLLDGGGDDGDDDDDDGGILDGLFEDDY